MMAGGSRASAWNCGHPPGTLVKGSWGKRERGEERGMIQGTEARQELRPRRPGVQVHWVPAISVSGCSVPLCASAVPTHSQEGCGS